MADKDGARKVLRTTLSAGETFLMLLMPASQVASYCLLYSATQAPDPAARLDLYSSVALIAAFYMGWAIKNRLEGKPEKAHVTFGLLLLASWQRHPLATAVCSAILWVNYAVPATYILAWPAAKYAHIAKKTLTFGYVKKVYYVSNLVFWALATKFLVDAYWVSSAGGR